MSTGLPKDWRWEVSSNILDIRDGTHDTPKYVNGNGIPLITSKNLKENKIDFEKISYISKEDHAEISKRSKVEAGDILFAMIGTIGNPAIIKGDANFSIKNVGLFKKNEDEILPSFLLNFLGSYTFEKQLNERKLLKGTTQKFIPLGNLRNIHIPLPPIPTQQAIVSKIEELFSEIEKGIESLFTARQQLKTYRQSVLKWAFEGKLTNSRNHDSYDLHDEHDLNIAAEPGNDYKPKNHGLDKGELPKGWKKITIAEIAIINPKLPDKENINENLEVQFLPMKLVEEIVNKFHLIETKTFKEVQRKSYTPFINGDIIFAKVTPCMENGKIAIVDNLKNGIGYGSSEFHVVRCSKDALNKYVFYFLVQDRFRNEAQNAMTGAVGLRRVPKQFIENHLITLPLIKEQKDIIEEIESRLSVADKMEESISESLQQAEALKQSILKKAFDGKLLS